MAASLRPNRADAKRMPPYSIILHGFDIQRELYIKPAQYPYTDGEEQWAFRTRLQQDSSRTAT